MASIFIELNKVRNRIDDVTDWDYKEECNEAVTEIEDMQAKISHIDDDIRTIEDSLKDWLENGIPLNDVAGALDDIKDQLKAIRKLLY